MVLPSVSLFTRRWWWPWMPPAADGSRTAPGPGRPASAAPRPTISAMAPPIPASTSSNTMQRESRPAQATCTARDSRASSPRRPPWTRRAAAAGIGGHPKLDLVDAMRLRFGGIQGCDIDLEPAPRHAQLLHVVGHGHCQGPGRRRAPRRQQLGPVRGSAPVPAPGLRAPSPGRFPRIQAATVQWPVPPPVHAAAAGATRFLRASSSMAASRRCT